MIMEIDLCYEANPRDEYRETEMNLASLDMNLVVALRMLLEERNVTRAGQRVGLSQPAMSAALARLRRHFDDELLIRVGGSFELTPLASSLVDRTNAAYELLERVFTAQAVFDPATETREFTLLVTDYGVTVFGAALSRALHREAPGLRLTFQQTGTLTEDTASLLMATDGVVLPHGIIDDFPAAELFQDRWVCMVSADNKEVGAALTIGDLERLPWAVYQRPYDAPAARQLNMIGITPRVEVSVPGFGTLPFVVEGTSRVALIQERLADRVAATAAVRILPCPFAAVPVQEALWWHPVHAQDAGHIWLREKAVEVGRALG